MAPIEFDDEDEDSLEDALTPEEVGEAVVFSTDWTVGTLLGQLRHGNIELGPRFQRRDAWSLERKSRYIESLILQLPVPHIVLAERLNQKGSYLVLDGRQRLLSLMQFCGIADPMNAQLNFRLADMEVLQDLEGKTWADLPTFGTLKTQFENATVRSVVVRNWKTERLLHLLFTRLNTESTKLNAQELRLAAYPGDFVFWVDDASVASVSLKRLFALSPGSPGEPRMRDVELLVRYFAFRNHFSRYKGPMRPFLDRSCLELNRGFSTESQELQRQLEAFERGVEHGYRVFGDDFGHRWNAKTNSFVGRPNRAVVDVLVHYLSLIASNDLLVAGPKMRDVLIDLFSNNADFVRSINLTSRHARESVQRFPIMGRALNQAGVACPVTGA
jgi:hypothetical protein